MRRHRHPPAIYASAATPDDLLLLASDQVEHPTQLPVGVAQTRLWFHCGNGLHVCALRKLKQVDKQSHAVPRHRIDVGSPHSL